MKKFFLLIFNFLYKLFERNKPHTNDFPSPQEENEKIKRASIVEDVKLRSRNNRLLIEYNGKSPWSGHNMSFFRVGKNKKRLIIHRPGSMYKGKIDSLRCTEFERAKDIIRPFREYVKRAIFTDSTGTQFKIA